MRLMSRPSLEESHPPVTGQRFFSGRDAVAPIDLILLKLLVVRGAQRSPDLAQQRLEY